jgi:hypothetical protein
MPILSMAGLHLLAALTASYIVELSSYHVGVVASRFIPSIPTKEVVEGLNGFLVSLRDE